jgi:DNA invertase Pin-like site-specific DNA recombinase
MRVATYTRISTDEERQPYSLEAQATRLESYIASQDGWELARTFTDQCSGATLDRPALQRALREARAQRFELLLVYRVDRLARSVRGLAHILEELDKASVAFRSATEPFDTATSAGRMMVQMLGVFAEFERATIVDRVVAGMERKAARGGWTSGTYPFGYSCDPTAGYLVPRADESPLVPLIFEMYVKGRHGARTIAAWLNQRGHRTHKGRPWSGNAVVRVIRNRAYVGEVFFRNAWIPRRIRHSSRRSSSSAHSWCSMHAATTTRCARPIRPTTSWLDWCAASVAAATTWEVLPTVAAAAIATTPAGRGSDTAQTTAIPIACRRSNSRPRSLSRCAGRLLSGHSCRRRCARGPRGAKPHGRSTRSS